MKKLLLALALLLLPSVASAQCNGIFANNTVCGNVSGAPNLPQAAPLASFALGPAGTAGQLQTNNGASGFAAMPAMNGDCTLDTSTGVNTCTGLRGANNTWSGTNTFSGVNTYTNTQQFQAPAYFGGKPWFDVLSNANGCAAADPTGVADSTTAIQCHINYLHTTYGGGVVYFSPGGYKVSSVVVVSGGVWLVGPSIDSANVFTTVDTRVFWFYTDAGTQTCPTGGMNGGIDKLSVYGYQNAAATQGTVEVGANCLVNIYNSRLWFGAHGLKTAGTDGLCFNSFISGYTNAVYSSGANWWVRCKLDSISAGVPSFAAFVQGANAAGLAIVENYFDMVDMTVSGASYSFYYDDSTSNGYVKFTNTIFNAPFNVVHVNKITMTGTTFGSSVALGVGSMAISGSMSISPVTVTGAGTRSCAANINITC